MKEREIGTEGERERKTEKSNQTSDLCRKRDKVDFLSTTGIESGTAALEATTLPLQHYCRADSSKITTRIRTHSDMTPNLWLKQKNC